MRCGREPVREQRGEFPVGTCVLETGRLGHLSLLDADHDRGDDVGDEGRVDVAQFAGRNSLGDELADAVGGEPGVAFVHLARDRRVGNVLHEPRGGGFEFAPHGLEIGTDASLGVRGPRDVGLHPFGGTLEEVDGRRVDEPVLVLRECVERRFRAAQTRGDVVEGQVREAFCQEQRDQIVEQLRLPGGGPPATDSCHTENSTAVSSSVLFSVPSLPGGTTVPVERLLPTREAYDLIDLTRDVADKVLTPRVDEHERKETFPEGVFPALGAAGLLSLPYPEEFGGGDQPYEVYLQVLEELGARWAAVAVAVSVHGLSCFALATHGTDEQKNKWLPEMLGGNTIGAYSLSEPQAGSDAAALACRAKPVDGGYRITGSKAWITNGGKADFYTLFARTADTGSKGISCFLVPAGTEGLSFGKPEEKMGLHAIPTTSAHYDDAFVPAERRIGAEGQGLPIAFSALDSGRLGIAAVATGLAQAALDEATAYAKERQAFGKRIIDHQGLGFVLADMAAAVDSARATYLDAARRKDAGLPYSRQASVAKLVATDAAMKVTTDAVQVLGGYGYTRDFPVERFMRDAKITQIFEGTNQIQRLVIARSLAG